jgi:hypothetical protein
MGELRLNVLDLTPFNEPIEVKIEKWGLGGWQVKCRVRIDYRWDTECEYLEANRIFGHKGDPTDEELKKEFATAIADIAEKRLWVFKANHGLLDKNDNTIRFKK